MKGFIGQEAHHGNEHDAFNAFMESKGVPTGKVDAYVKDGLKFMAKWLSPERQLAKTCALEHFTAMLAEMILEDPEFIEGMDERMVPLWLWHAVEESEHKSVAFDVYRDQVDSYWVRTSEMALPPWNLSVLLSCITTSCAPRWMIPPTGNPCVRGLTGWWVNPVGCASWVNLTWRITSATSILPSVIASTCASRGWKNCHG